MCTLVPEGDLFVWSRTRVFGCVSGWRETRAVGRGGAGKVCFVCAQVKALTAENHRMSERDLVFEEIKGESEHSACLDIPASCL